MSVKRLNDLSLVECIIGRKGKKFRLVNHFLLSLKYNFISYTLGMNILKNIFNPVKIAPKFRRGAVLVFFKDSVEVRNIVKTTVITDFRNTVIGFDEASCGRS